MPTPPVRGSERFCQLLWWVRSGGEGTGCGWEDDDAGGDACGHCCHLVYVGQLEFLSPCHFFILPSSSIFGLVFF